MIEWWKHNFGAGKIRMCPGKKQGRAGSRRNGEQEKQKMERRFKIQSNLRIVNCEKKEKAFGPGIAALLEGVETHGSLRKAQP